MNALRWQRQYKTYPYTYNIANADAVHFYAKQGLTDLPMAFEKGESANLQTEKSELLMQCRHCLRYAMGHCIRHGGKQPQWQEPLFLELPDGRRFRLGFDCQNCQMNIYADK